MKKKSNDIVIGRKNFILKQVNINEHYTVFAKPLGRGSYGAVHVCTHILTKQTRAVKIISKSKVANLEAFINEVDILRSVVKRRITILSGSSKYHKAVRVVREQTTYLSHN